MFVVVNTYGKNDVCIRLRQSSGISFLSIYVTSFNKIIILCGPAMESEKDLMRLMGGCSGLTV